jgi:hypothetical protein
MEHRMNTLKRITTVVAIIAILGLSGCFWGRGGWGGHHNERAAEQRIF